MSRRSYASYLGRSEGDSARRVVYFGRWFVSFGSFTFTFRSLVRLLFHPSTLLNFHCGSALQTSIVVSTCNVLIYQMVFPEM